MKKLLTIPSLTVPGVLSVTAEKSAKSKAKLTQLMTEAHEASPEQISDRDLTIDFIATSVAINDDFFGHKGNNGKRWLDPKEDITDKTGNPANVAALTLATNRDAPGTFVLWPQYGFSWDDVTVAQLSACKVVEDYIDLVMKHIT